MVMLPSHGVIILNLSIEHGYQSQRKHLKFHLFITNWHSRCHEVHDSRQIVVIFQDGGSPFDNLQSGTENEFDENEFSDVEIMRG